MIKPFTVPVYAFVLGHGVSANSASRLDIRLVNEANRYFHLEDQTVVGQPLTEYKLTINNPSALDFSSSEEIMVCQRTRDIILAMNLIFDEIVLFTEEKKFLNLEFSTNEKVKEEVNISMRRETQQQLDESSIISNLNLIDKVDRHRHTEDRQGDTPKKNLAKALNEYEKAVSQTNLEHIFKDIFNAVEYAVNSDTHRPGEKMDIEFSRLVSLPTVDQNKVFHWREKMYYRLKHPDHINQRTDQPEEYRQAQKDIPNELVPMRQAANIVIIKRLEKL